MDAKKQRIVIALGGNALGNTLPEQMEAVKITAKAIVDLIEEGCEVIVAHGNGPQVGMINNAMAALSREDASQPNTPLSVCVAMSQAYIGYDLQNALREELYNREIHHIPVATMITQVRVDADDPAFDNPTKPIGRFMTVEQAKTAEERYGYIMREDAGRGYRRVVASPKPAEIVEIGAIRSLVDSGQLVIACGGGGIPVTRQGNHLKGTGAVIDKDFASELLAEELMKTTKDGKALYLHCLPADINDVSCKDGEVEASVFDRYRDPLYKEASFKPYVIAAMIMLAKFADPAEVLKKLEEKGTPRVFK